MDDRFNILSGAILDKPLEQCTVQELEEMVAAYPYFAAAHFLLLKKKEETGEDTSAVMQKTMLYYHDPVSFGHFIHPQKTEERFLYESESKPTPITPPFIADVSTIPPQPAAEAEITPEVIPSQLVPEPKTTAEAIGIPTLPHAQAEPVAHPQAAEEPLAFEPFHTVDYFASQGIKPSKEEPKDTLGKQLKSFTEWLKTMKKLPDAAATAARPADPAVEAMASRSVGDTVVVTEAMAEVWLKQGNKERAKEIYHKLSLLEPSKSRYFAAKIDNLNAD